MQQPFPLARFGWARLFLPIQNVPKEAEHHAQLCDERVVGLTRKRILDYAFRAEDMDDKGVSKAMRQDTSTARLPATEAEEQSSSAPLRDENERNGVACVILADGELGGSVSEVIQHQLADEPSALQHHQFAVLNRQVVAGQDVQGQGVGDAAADDYERSATLQNLVDDAGDEDDHEDAEHIECDYLWHPRPRRIISL
jgi:hypothetical protein